MSLLLPLLWPILVAGLTANLARTTPWVNAGLSGVMLLLLGITLVPAALSPFDEVRLLRRCRQLARQAPSQADPTGMDTVARAQVAAVQRDLPLASWGMALGAAGACAAAWDLWLGVAVPLAPGYTRPLAGSGAAACAL